MAGSTNIGEFIFFRFIAGASAFMLLGAVPVSTESSQSCSHNGECQSADKNIVAYERGRA